MLLTDRVGVVSGVGPGTGRAIALALARHGADVVLAARTPRRLDEVASEVEALGQRALAVPTDVTDEAQCYRLVDAALDAFGRLDVVVHNAFVQPPLEPIEATTTDTWRAAFEVNLFAGVQLSRAVLPRMKEQRSGAIVFVGSMSARRIRPDFGVYAASKAAVLTTAQTLAREVGEHGIRVNTVVPGYIWEAKLQWWFGQLAEREGRTPEEVYEEVAAETALRHLPTPEEVADAVVFLASDMARSITGQALDVNGGHWLH